MKRVSVTIVKVWGRRRMDTTCPIDSFGSKLSCAKCMYVIVKEAVKDVDGPCTASKEWRCSLSPSGSYQISPDQTTERPSPCWMCDALYMFSMKDVAVMHATIMLLPHHGDESPSSRSLHDRSKCVIVESFRILDFMQINKRSGSHAEASSCSNNFFFTWVLLQKGHGSSPAVRQDTGLLARRYHSLGVRPGFRVPSERELTTTSSCDLRE